MVTTSPGLGFFVKVNVPVANVLDVPEAIVTVADEPLPGLTGTPTPSNKAETAPPAAVVTMGVTVNGFALAVVGMDVIVKDPSTSVTLNCRLLTTVNVSVS
jgi:hypothetical protein